MLRVVRGPFSDGDKNNNDHGKVTHTLLTVAA